MQAQVVKVHAVPVGNQPETKVACRPYIQHGLPLSTSGQFYISASCVLPDHLFTLVSNLGEGSLRERSHRHR